MSINRSASLLSVLLLLSVCIGNAAEQPTSGILAYRATLDLVNVKNDAVKVSVQIPQSINSASDEYTYIIPRSVPGTYSKDDYGKFVDDAKAWDASNHALPVKRVDNDIVVSGKPARIEYWVRDTWDDPLGEEVFQPTGTNIQKDTNFVINTHGFFGYIDGTKFAPYEITVTKPKGFFGATSLNREELNATTDVLRAKSYPHLVDNPVMYCVPDTISFVESGNTIMIAVYSANKKVKATDVANDLRPVAHALGKFFGTMPVDHYTFLFYFAGIDQKQIQRTMSYGALEHSYSSMYFLPEGMGGRESTEMVRSTAAHEFLHILIPLNLHSKEIHDFDFKNPKMSQHLWLYEGCTEYFSTLARVQDNILSEKAFMNEMRQKIASGAMMTRSKPLSLVTLSKRVLEPEYQKIYPIIYEKGAATAFMLDIRLRELSKNTLTLLGLIQKLTEKYGPERPFDDDQLFGEIESIVGKEIKPFFDDYIIGDKQIPYNEFLEKIGYTYKDSGSVKSFAFGGSNIYFKRGSGELTLLRVRGENDFNAKDEDTLVRVNDVIVTPENRMEVMGMHVWTPRDDKPVTLTVRRGTEEILLSATPKITQRPVRHVVEQNPNATPEQLQLRKSIIEH